jgi:fumarate reductase subunit D
VNQSTPRGGDWSTPSYGGSRREPSRPSAPVDDGWGASTTVRRGGPGRDEPATQVQPRVGADDQWSPAGPTSGREQRATRAAERRAQREAQLEGARRREPEADATPQAPERGLPWWGALLILVGIAVIGGVVDAKSSSQGAFNIAIIAASVISILVVRRSHMFPIVIAPPIVYSVASMFMLYIRSDGLHDKKQIIDAAANYLVYGFPAIASATAAVLIIAGIRMIARK